MKKVFNSFLKITLIVCLLLLVIAILVDLKIRIRQAENTNEINELLENFENENDTAAWQLLTSQQNSFVRTLPARAMEVVQEVVGSFRQELRIVIITPNGKLKGRQQNYKSGVHGFFYSFKGIRYGQPPTGKRRFKSALPEKPWRNTRNALREGNSCPHRNMILNTYKGDEDCLFLNVYTPELPTKNRHPKLPVMFFIHGGGYSFGSGNSFIYGPDFLLAEDVVLVTINYRLGALGFLSVGGDAPGNAGLKDQVLALKWVQENIAAFGGNPSEVTIFGESAGASSVEYLMISPMAAGLFHRAISQSGSALNPWAMARNSRERAFKLGAVLGFRTNSTKALLEFLRKEPARHLVDSATKTLSLEDARNQIGLPFVPTIEDWENESGSFHDFRIQENLISDQTFMSESPMKTLISGKITKIPYMTGFNSHEALLFMRKLTQDPSLLDTINNDFIRMVPNNMLIPGGRDSLEGYKIAQKMRDFYVGQRPVSEETIEEMIFLLTDLMFLKGISDSARLHARGSNSTYMYRFGFDGSLGLYKRLLGISRPGACHGDELGYLFQFGAFSLSLDAASSEIQVKKRMVKMWTNFAKYGNPTPLGELDPVLAVNWLPVTTDSNHLNYLDITARLLPKVNPESERLKFWDEIYSKYGAI